MVMEWVVERAVVRAMEWMVERAVEWMVERAVERAMEWMVEQAVEWMEDCRHQNRRPRHHMRQVPKTRHSTQQG